ncbi:MAG: chemotaxis protein CheW, partial [Deltaproteobacteria bacterium]|nr:chemotaxis protein CheW [Deltaproteobacteria bacterium]
ETPIKLILLTHRNGSIFVRNKLGEYREPFQSFFRGKQFFIPHKMSIHHMLAHMFFSKIGLKPGAIGEAGVEVGFEVVPPIKMPEFLNGNAGASGFMVAEPIGTKAIASGIAELQFLSSELWKNHPCCVVAARDDFIGPYTDAVYEFSEMLVQAGKFIEKKPDTAAEVAVSFLDPDKKLGLKVPLLKNVLTEAQGIKTGDLFPSIDDLDRIQKYMYHDMGIGSLIDLEKFVDMQFAETVCRDRKVSAQVSVPANMDGLTQDILQRGATAAEKTSKAMLNKEGKYLTFALGQQEFGIDILKVKEIIGMAPIRTIPQAPPYIKGVVNLRGKVISVMDLRLKFGMEEMAYTDRTCIIVLEVDGNGRATQVGIAVDAVSEVRDIKASEIEETPSFGARVKTNAILAMAKIDGGVKILLDIDKVIN